MSPISADWLTLRDFAARYTAAWCSQNPASVARSRLYGKSLVFENVARETNVCRRQSGSTTLSKKPRTGSLPHPVISPPKLSRSRLATRDDLVRKRPCRERVTKGLQCVKAVSAESLRCAAAIAACVGSTGRRRASGYETATAGRAGFVNLTSKPIGPVLIWHPPKSLSAAIGRNSCLV